jgi:predicted dehydrogenase
VRAGRAPSARVGHRRGEQQRAAPDAKIGRMNTPLRVGLIGFGYAGRTIHAPLIAATPGLQLAAIGSSQPAAVAAAWPGVRVVGDYAALARDPGCDLVVIATPNQTHFALGCAALEAGRHVVIDKPFTVTLAEADALVALAARRGRLLSVFHNRRWDGDFLSLQECIASGRLGDVRELVSRIDRFDPLPRDRWRERAAPGGGLWFDLGPHLIDQALCLFGPPQTVTADLAVLRDGAAGDDYAQVVLGYPQRRVTLHCTRLAAAPGPRFEAHGTQASFVCHGLDVQEAQLKAGQTPGCAGWGDDPQPVFVTDGRTTPRSAEPMPRVRGDWRRYYAGVRDAIAGSGANPVPPAEARRVMAVLDCATTSAREGRTLRFE